MQVRNKARSSEGPMPLLPVRRERGAPDHQDQLEAPRPLAALTATTGLELVCPPTRLLAHAHETGTCAATSVGSSPFLSLPTAVRLHRVGDRLGRLEQLPGSLALDLDLLTLDRVAADLDGIGAGTATPLTPLSGVATLAACGGVLVAARSVAVLRAATTLERRLLESGLGVAELPAGHCPVLLID